MESWLSELFSPGAIVRNLALLLLVVAVATPGVLAIRLFLLGSGVLLVILAAGFADDPVGLFWAILFVLVNVIQIVMFLRTDRAGPLNPEERLFHEKVVPSLNPAQTRKLLAAGQWRDVAAGTALTRQGEVTGELCFVSRGAVDIMVDGGKVAEVGPGSLIGEIGLSTGDPATATAVCATTVRYLGFEAARLYAVLDRHVDIQDAIELAIQRSLRDKLARSNTRKAHGEQAD